jgi:hypothetical protein
MAYNAGATYSPVSEIISNFNEVNNHRTDVFCKIAELKDGYRYRLKKLSVVPTRYGDSLLADIADGTGTDLRVFLPRKFYNILTDRCITLLNCQVGLYIMFIEKGAGVKECRITE